MVHSAVESMCARVSLHTFIAPSVQFSAKGRREKWKHSLSVDVAKLLFEEQVVPTDTLHRSKNYESYIMKYSKHIKKDRS